MRVVTPNIFSFDNKNKKQQNFCALKKDFSVLPIINKMSESDILELHNIEKRLSKTKFWDMKISTIGNSFKEFVFQFIDKNNKHGVITDGIYPYQIDGSTIKIYTFIYGPENLSKNLLEELKFKSPQRAAEVYEKYINNMEYVRNRAFNLTPIESIKNKEIELNMLEEASQTAEITKNARTINPEKLTKKTIGNDFY